MANPRLFTTDKGKEGLIHNDFCYREVKKRAADRGIFWRCVRKDCQGRMKTDEDKAIVLYGGGHNHQPNVIEVGNFYSLFKKNKLTRRSKSNKWQLG